MCPIPDTHPAGLGDTPMPGAARGLDLASCPTVVGDCGSATQVRDSAATPARGPLGPETEAAARWGGFAQGTNPASKRATIWTAAGLLPNSGISRRDLQQVRV